MPVLEQLLEKFPDQVKVMYKNFPLRRHRYARLSAAAAMAAHGQNKFWPFHDKLLENYNKINEAKIEEIRAVLKLDPLKFNSQRKARHTQSLINRDMLEARKAGVNSTPTVFINGRLQRRRSLDALSKAVVTELKRIDQQ